MTEQRWRVAVFTAAILVMIVFLVKLLQTEGTPGALLGAIIAVFAVLAVIPRLFDLVELNLPGVKAKLQKVSSEVAETQKAVQEVNDRIDWLFANSLSSGQYFNLEKLASGRFGPYVMSLGLENDLRHLRNHGYIEVRSVRDLPKQAEDLSRYVKVTDTAHALLRFRKALRIPMPELQVQSELLSAYREGAERDVPREDG